MVEISTFTVTIIVFLYHPQAKHNANTKKLNPYTYQIRCYSNMCSTVNMTMLSNCIAQSDIASVQECVMRKVTVLRSDEYVSFEH